MILMGDEVRRTQHGNNNAYCQDNETSWFHWGQVLTHADVHRFVRLLIQMRLRRKRRWVSLTQLLQEAEHAWHGVRLRQPDWSRDSHSLAFEADLHDQGLYLYLILNAYWEPLNFELPSTGGAGWEWRRWIDTSLDPPNEIVEWGSAPAVPELTYRAGARSVVVLGAGPGFSQG
jgi:glycogen operon protein